MRQRLCNIVAGLSLLLCAAMGGFWLRSAYHYDRVDYTHIADPAIVRRTWKVTSHAGQCTIGFIRFDLYE